MQSLAKRNLIPAIFPIIFFLPPEKGLCLTCYNLQLFEFSFSHLY